ncbi:hypothetical protein [Brenneria uluponensis]|nr:hypothetical protein [Brenneria ulupoensis]
MDRLSPIEGDDLIENIRELQIPFLERDVANMGGCRYVRQG